MGALFDLIQLVLDGRCCWRRYQSTTKSWNGSNIQPDNFLVLKSQIWNIWNFILCIRSGSTGLNPVQFNLTRLDSVALLKWGDTLAFWSHVSLGQTKSPHIQANLNTARSYLARTLQPERIILLSFISDFKPNKITSWKRRQQAHFGASSIYSSASRKGGF